MIEQRITDRLPEPDQLLDRADRIGRAGDDRHAGRLHRLRAAVFEPISSIASGGGPIHTRPASSTARAKRRVLREEAVARMHRLGARPGRGVDDPLNCEIALRRRRRADQERLVGIPGVQRPRSASEYTATEPMPSSRSVRKIADRDLAPIRDQDLAEIPGMLAVLSPL